MDRNYPAIAHAILSDGHGTLRFTQERPEYDVRVEIDAHGFSRGDHGLHVHATGDTSGGCETLGPHFDTGSACSPCGHAHGGRESRERHAGDFGNVRADSFGHIRDSFRVRGVSLYDGPASIVGRGIVVHAGRDDLGRGKTDESRETGCSGARVSCGVIHRVR